MVVVALLALGASFLYAIGSLQLKGALQEGVAVSKVASVTNVAMALFSLPLLFWATGPIDSMGLILGALAGVCLFGGRYLAIKALSEGDLSLVGPILSLKTLLLGLMGMLSGQLVVTWYHWIIIAVGTLGVVLLQQRGGRAEGRETKALLLAMGASVLFALTDLLVVRARDSLALGWLLPTVFLSLVILTPFLGKPWPLPMGTRKPLFKGASVLGFQTTLVVLLIAWSGEAIMINILYTSRSIWTVMADRWAGKGQALKGAFQWRLTGALCIFSAVVAIVSTSALEHHRGIQMNAEIQKEEHRFDCPCCSGAYPL